MIIVRAPFRVSFLGGGTDFPSWYRENPGAVLSTAIDKYCYINARWLPPFFEHKHRIVWSQIEVVQEFDEIKHDSVREIMKDMKIKRGIEIHHAGDLPARTGIGSSSSFAVAMYHALHVLLGHNVDKKKLANEAINLEQNLCGRCTGSQDQVASAYGGFNRIDFIGGKITVKRMEAIKSDKLVDSLMMFFTGFQRNAEKIEKEKLANRDDGAFKALYSLVDEGEKALQDGNLVEFGKLLDLGWAIKKGMAENTSNGYIDYLYETGLKAGAIGGKLMGAGGGGFLLFLVEPDKQDNVRKALQCLEVPFKFDWQGSQVVVNNDEGSDI